MFENEIANQYDAWYETPLGSFVDQVETNAAMSLFAPSPNTNILDAGCGTGNFSLKLHQCGCSVTGIDLSADMLTIARRKVLNQNADIKFQEMDLSHLDFPDNNFDGVFSMAAFEFIHDWKPAFDELYRILKPGGRLLIGTINKTSSWGRMYEDHARRDESSVFRHASLKTLDDLKQLDEKHLIATEGCIYIPPDAQEHMLNKEEEHRLSTLSSPGFILGLWEKP